MKFSLRASWNQMFCRLGGEVDYSLHGMRKIGCSNTSRGINKISRRTESFICSNESFIRPNDLLLRPNESFIRSNESFIRSNDSLFVRTKKYFFFNLASLRRRNCVSCVTYENFH